MPKAPPSSVSVPNSLTKSPNFFYALKTNKQTKKARTPIFYFFTSMPDLTLLFYSKLKASNQISFSVHYETEKGESKL